MVGLLDCWMVGWLSVVGCPFLVVDYVLWDVTMVGFLDYWIGKLWKCLIV